MLRPFVRPATTYGAGHRGVDLAGSPGQDVQAVSDGTVSHVGRVAGRGTVTVLHASGVRSTYEPVRGSVATGAVVARGAVLGTLEVSGSHCGVATCLHLGAVGAETYLDPMVFLVGGQRVRLLPLGQAPEG
jgi:murein DD-endopeptidase MepM/ murein hydrolase activator NlpD